MQTIRLAFFVCGEDARIEAGIGRWRELAEHSGFELQTRVHDIRKSPELARRYDVFCTPTTIAEFPDGRVMHYVGLGGDLDAFLRACGWKSTTETLGESARELIVGSAKLRDASLRKIEAARVRSQR